MYTVALESPISKWYFTMGVKVSSFVMGIRWMCTGCVSHSLWRMCVNILALRSFSYFLQGWSLLQRAIFGQFGRLLGWTKREVPSGHAGDENLGENQKFEWANWWSQHNLKYLRTFVWLRSILIVRIPQGGLSYMGWIFWSGSSRSKSGPPGHPGFMVSIWHTSDCRDRTLYRWWSPHCRSSYT